MATCQTFSTPPYHSYANSNQPKLQLLQQELQVGSEGPGPATSLSQSDSSIN